ncbi:STAS domain-containing protein [Litoribacillus peritrichatus]|uniref:Anti-sigma factor antagonist n=1 Tax=Litoribacillus peritrichatus TaxID=718191 RepID=A0ABP7M933_9GAMM
MALDIQVVDGQSSKVKRVILAGSLDSDTAPELEALVSELVASDLDLLIFDMKPLEFISSAGLRVVFMATKQMKAKGGRLAVANRQVQITKVFEIVKALPDLTIFRDDAEMDDYLAAMQEKFRSGQD